MHLSHETVPIQVPGINLNLSTIHRLISAPPIVFLHGFGSCKEDLADLVLHPAMQENGFIAYDAPGCGHSTTDNLSATDIPFLVATAEAFLEHFNIKKFHIMGHSMGGFVDIKGNLAPEDCFLSRQIFTFPLDDPEKFFDEFIDRTRKARSYSNPLYASALRLRVRAGAVRPIFESMVQLSDHEDLLGIFLSLPFPKMFMFGEECRDLSYLPRLQKEGVELAEIPQSGHFPMYSNPVEMYKRIAAFLHLTKQS
ncbi:alpha/beta-hydrolase [Penicillium maclennaniae]|uniref:alpha/beta-hydrolase n=1 Tax=Penicillium maclennaniae TaxID=1343394 RepID=UPI0025423B94|nr:alpha/beta-hydrolase [Penicillium maclennaniae]KAJ5670351.1 alpha/beta-hydrolase [Penicillium maclennaniae]